jgi:secondary thiamine-phosphate synthase enzyme
LRGAWLNDNEVKQMELKSIQVSTQGRMHMLDITRAVESTVRASRITEGTAFLYMPHTTCALTIQENADPGVQHDMHLLLGEIAPRDDARYRHIEDNSASHLQASMIGFSTFVFVQHGALVLGRWQGIYVAEFDGPRQRTVYVKVIADHGG